MTVYIDKDYKCHAEAGEGLRAFEVPFFEGKCGRFIKGCRYVPGGETWLRSDGVEFAGEMLAPAEDLGPLTAAQQLYEEMYPELAELREKLQRLQDCLDGLASYPGLEQLQDFLLIIREVMEDE